MPWKETDAMKEKRSFIEAMLKQNRPFVELCRDYGISEEKPFQNAKCVIRRGIIVTSGRKSQNK